MRKVLRILTITILAIITILVIIVVGLWFWLNPVNRDSPIYLVGNYVFVDCDICKANDNGSLHIVIPGEVCDYMYDENYIIAYQRPSFVRADYFWKYDNTIDKDSILSLKKECKEIKDCYWIINVQNDSVIGPMDKKMFEYKCSVMGMKIKMGQGSGDHLARNMP